jgi:hypothetical protein
MIAQKVAPRYYPPRRFVVPASLTPLSALAMGKLAEAGIPERPVQRRHNRHRPGR